jgi:glycosyltransferase involved in cell wall biosynthesis
VLPSTLPDPLPTVVLEAMAACRPVVATAHGGALEMVADGETGYLIPYNDAEQAFLIMEPLICNHDLRVDMGTKGGERVRSLFSREAYKTKMLSTLRDLLPSQAICAH